ncbi:hypothetical protein N9N03_00335 [Chlamydiia bacterium]|nr:hypothetical protein [Chlamydiia bacterium]
MLDVDVICMILPQLFLLQTLTFPLFSLLTLHVLLWLDQKKTNIDKSDIEGVKKFVSKHNETLCVTKPLVVAVINDITDPGVAHNKAFTFVDAYKRS